MIDSAQDSGLFKGVSRPYIIAGPCSAESEDQIINSALALKERGISFFRAGVWKPRSHPDSFEGAGDVALNWLQRVNRELGMDVATEVASPEHIEKVLSHGINTIWIGARTTTNPFMLQEIVSALKGEKVSVLIKNPVTPDIELWVGAVERFLKGGIDDLCLVHRGFFLSEEDKYRNSPCWHIPIEIKQRYPDIPLLCDPSHISGIKAYIPELSQKALDLNFDGLMIESHFDPGNALSDKDQQLTPDELADLLKSLSMKSRNSFEADPHYLNSLRVRIDEIDEAIVRLIARRTDIAEQIGEYKRENNLSVLQYERWAEVLNKVLTLGKQYDLDPTLLKNLYSIIHEISINKQF